MSIRFGGDASPEQFRSSLKAAEVRGGWTQSIRDVICRKFGHRDLWGPRGGDHRVICAFCHSVLNSGTP